VVNSPSDEQELHKVTTFANLLIKATAVLDHEFLAEKGETTDLGEESRHHYATTTHYHTGDVSKVLQDLHKNLNREHDEQFKNRVKDIYEKSRRKEHQHYESHEL